MSIRLYNTLSRTKEPLEPVVPGKIGIYLCGPTVYKPSHIGHMVGPVIFDTIKRYLVYNGYQVKWVVNITDVDDKLIIEAMCRGVPMSEVAEEMTDDYLRNLEALGVDGVDDFPRATQHIGAIVSMIQSLLEKGFAYVAVGDVYFDVGKDREYGKLSRRSLESMQGEGGEASERKRSMFDFALWKGAKSGEPSWESPWGLGRPGWHIECSAMSRALLGETFDIHGGGLDLVFPHHENEIAQSECCHGRPMAKYWLHNGLMQASGEIGKVGGRQTRAIGQDDLQTQAAAKISKSTGASPFRELLARHAPETIRFFLLTTHYRRPIDYSDGRIDEVHTGLESFYRFFRRYERITGETFYSLVAPQSRAEGDTHVRSGELLEQFVMRRQKFLAAMDDDFNTGGAVGELFELVRMLNKYCDDTGLEAQAQRDAAALVNLDRGATLLRELGAILGLFRAPPRENRTINDCFASHLIELLVQLRATARIRKDFATSDRIRARLEELGVALEDRADGTTTWSLASRER